MTYNFTLETLVDHEIEVEANARYVDNSFSHAFGTERCIDFECEIERVKLVSRSGKSSREINLEGRLFSELKGKIKKALDSERLERIG